MIEICLLDKTIAMERRGARSSKFHDLIRRGLMVPPVHVGRAARFPLHEVNAVAAAQMAGATDPEIKVLVAELVAKRAEIFKEWRTAALAVEA